MSVPLTDMVQYLDDLLDIHAIPDYGINGLQVEGPGLINKVATAVDADLAAIEGAIREEAQLLLVHHGLFWERQMRPITGPEYRRIKAILDGDLAVYAAHLPLDAHPEVGNNAALATAADGRNLKGWGNYKGHTIGLSGTLPKVIKRDDLQAWAQKCYGECLQVITTGPTDIESIAFCSGAAADLAEQALSDGIDLYITGEPRHSAMHRIRESGQNVVFLGHHTSERGGPKNLGAHLSQRFDIPWTFIDSPTGV